MAFFNLGSSGYAVSGFPAIARLAPPFLPSLRLAMASTSTPLCGLAPIHGLPPRAQGMLYRELLLVHVLLAQILCLGFLAIETFKNLTSLIKIVAIFESCLFAELLSFASVQASTCFWNFANFSSLCLSSFSSFFAFFLLLLFPFPLLSSLHS